MELFREMLDRLNSGYPLGMGLLGEPQTQCDPPTYSLARVTTELGRRGWEQDTMPQNLLFSRNFYSVPWVNTLHIIANLWVDFQVSEKADVNYFATIFIAFILK